jgi:hypothetical protein
MKNKSFLHLTHTPIKPVSSKLASLFLAAGLIAATPVIAETPDGTTPANEGVCDGLKTNATPGLYGLCVAYCEAQDLDLVGDKETPNNKILANYNKKKQTGDPPMPCVKVPCPCWTEAQLVAVNNPDLSRMLCSQTANTATVRNLSPVQFASVDTGALNCRFTDSAAMPPISVRLSGADVVSLNGAQSCYSQIIQKCQALGLLPP